MATRKTTAIAKTQNVGVSAPMPVGSLGELVEVGRLFERSGMFGCREPGQGVVVALTCRMRGIDPIEFQATYNIIDGTPSMRADAMLARFGELGGSYKMIERTPARAEIHVTYREHDKERFSLTWEEAQAEPFTKKKDGGIKTNWKTPRARMQMLWARVVSDAIRVVAPEVNHGTYTPEEVADFDHAREVAVEVSPPVARAVQPQEQAQDVTEGQIVDKPDPLVVPDGKLAGTPWADLDDGKLAKFNGWFKAKGGAVYPDHWTALKAEIAKRGKE